MFESEAMPYGIKPRLWTDEERDQVMRMLDAEEPASVIAEKFHLTRNAVIGRIARDKELHGHLKRMPKPKKIKRIVPLPQSQAKVADLTAALMSFIAAKRGKEPPQAPRPRPGKPAMRLLPLLELRANQCRWPVEEVVSITGGHLFCGADTAYGESYCPFHAAMSKPGGR